MSEHIFVQSQTIPARFHALLTELTHLEGLPDEVVREVHELLDIMENPQGPMVPREPVHPGRVLNPSDQQRPKVRIAMRDLKRPDP